MVKQPPVVSADALFAERADAEDRLLRRERKAERRLAAERDSLVAEQARLRKAEARVERRLAAIRDAEAVLVGRQAERAAGPAAPSSAREPLVVSEPAGSPPA